MKNKRVVTEKPNKKNTRVKLIAEINSTIKYFKLIFAEQSLHWALRTKKDINGMLSYHLICLLHAGQWDLPLITLILSGILWIQTLLKLPHILPKINTII